MKRIVLIALFGLLVLPIDAQSYRVATYNLRNDNPGDVLDPWKVRGPVVADLIRFYDFDIFGTQEGLLHQLEDLKNGLAGYDYIGVGRDDGDKKGEYSAIFYKTDKLRLLGKGNFWLSEDTEKPNMGWDAVCIRICSWGKFEEVATGKTFFMFNIHYDHIGRAAQMESSKLMIKKVREIAGDSPAILTGDFNVNENSESYLLLKNSDIFEDAYDLALIRFAPNGTFNGFEVTSKPQGRIDHIFLTSEFKVSRYGILTNIYNGRCPSDHFPVMVEVTL